MGPTHHPRRMNPRPGTFPVTALATTIHKSQGLTCDEAFVYADESIYR